MTAKTTAEPAPGAERLDLVLTRIIGAPRALVWKAWTEPAELPRWWGPKGFTCATKEIEIRPGGVWRFTMTGPDGTEYPNRISFLEVVAPERIVYTIDDDETGDMQPFHSTATFEDRAGRTLLTLSMLFDSAETRAAMIEFGAVEGGKSTLDCLEAHLAARAADGGG